MNKGEQILIADIQALEDRAHRLGLPITGHALNNAKNACGWEVAGNLVRARMATKAKRKASK